MVNFMFMYFTTINKYIHKIEWNEISQMMKIDSTQFIEKNLPRGLEGILKDTPQNILSSDSKFGKRAGYYVEC